MADQLENLVIHTETVSFKNGESDVALTVRGLGVPEIMGIVRQHRETLEAYYLRATTGEMGDVTAGDVAIEILADFEDIAMLIIAAALGSASVDKVRALPASVHLAVLEMAIVLTLTLEGGLGKVMEIVVRTMETMNTASFLER